MLNKNDNVNILAEPLQPLATKHKGMTDKALAAKLEFQYLVDRVETAEQDKSLRLVGFNEKLIYPKYSLPTQSSGIETMSNYLINNRFRYEFSLLSLWICAVRHVLCILSLCRMVFLLRKNVVYQAVSMIRAVQLASKCGNDGWSKVWSNRGSVAFDVHLNVLSPDPREGMAGSMRPAPHGSVAGAYSSSRPERKHPSCSEEERRVTQGKRGHAMMFSGLFPLTNSLPNLILF